MLQQLEKIWESWRICGGPGWNCEGQSDPICEIHWEQYVPIVLAPIRVQFPRYISQYYWISSYSCWEYSLFAKQRFFFQYKKAEADKQVATFWRVNQQGRKKRSALATQAETYREFTISNYRRNINAAYENKEKVFDRICKENGLKCKQVRKRYKLYVVNKHNDNNYNTDDSDSDVESLASQFSECRCQDVEIEESKLQLEEANTK